jgi:mono/diheme cytochrome c family protein
MLRKLLRIALILGVVLVGLAGLALAYLFLAFPKVSPPSSVKVVATPEKIARGEYLARHVAGCVVCHGTRDWRRFSGPLQPGTEGGGSMFEIGIASLHASNITPAGIGTWTDGELIRAITEGVSRNGRPLFPLMPYEAFGKMAPDDLDAIVAYVRSLKPIAIASPLPVTTVKFPLNLILRTIPGPAAPAPRPDPITDRIAYGKYVTTMASCGQCHTPREGDANEGKEFAGGSPFPLPGGRVQFSANITPDQRTGIGAWTEAQFVDRFKINAQLDDETMKAQSGHRTEMPWRDYAGMTREDLSAIYLYLRTVPAVANVVPRGAQPQPQQNASR